MSFPDIAVEMGEIAYDAVAGLGWGTFLGRKPKCALGDAGGLLWTGKYTPSTKIYWELMLSSLSTGPLTNLSAAITAFSACYT